VRTHIARGERILDVGCARGHYVKALRELGCRTVGLDLTRHDEWDMLRQGAFVVASVQALPFRDCSFDTVVAFEVLEHTLDCYAAAAEVARVSRRLAIASVPNCEIPPEFATAGLTFYHWTDPSHRWFFTEKSLESLLRSAGFVSVDIGRINAVSPAVLFLSSMRLPAALATVLGKALRHVPGSRRYCMTLIAVASGKVRAP